MTARSQQAGNGVAKRAWRTPALTEEAIADVTMNHLNSPGDDGSDQFGGAYVNTGLS